jgi:hypothetical protein
LLRSQLLEAGYEVLAADSWPTARQYLRAGMKARAVIVDLHGLPEPQRVLDELGTLINRDQVLVLTALRTLASDERRRLGFRVVERPATIGEIIEAVPSMLRTTANSVIRRLHASVASPNTGKGQAHIIREWLLPPERSISGWQ